MANGLKRTPGFFDFIIIGAGVIGSATACYLKKALPESRILLIDRYHTAGAGNTAKSAALFRNFFSSRTNRLLAGSSISYYLEPGTKVQLDPTGYLWLFSKEQWNASRTAIHELDPEKNKFEILDRDRIADILGINYQAKGHFPDVNSGIFCHLCGSLSATALARHYASLFKSMGGEINFNTDIKEFIITGQNSCYAPWDNVFIDGIVDQKGNTYNAKEFIVATGAWTHDLLAPIGIASGILPKKRQLFALKIENNAGLLADSTSTIRPAIILPAGGVYIKPVFDKNIIIVGCADDLGQPFLMSDPEPDPLYFQRAIEPVLNHYFPELDFILSLKWAGYYDYHWPDMTPVIESVANLTWVGGTSGSGIMKADAIGRIAAARVQGHKEALLADGSKFRVSRLSLQDRDVEKEELII
ncbi:MAG: Monomeric sarcosine oxidase [Candidatus Methanoperedens nitroreducens]|uniref:Monomeric sarcosine oxidase n=1 Tax=Candidatus Methanoperedens nitratireducens TaxID=1392998 RepID=A0A0P8AD95_9EURY|nr:FAD-dependent oxidoreductase [Candidatus Methanoperedens sp. BLZ2]KAB2940737.1 MAG: FAD-binding oxidoreductase [Candidatus Methanoperedens sp.]KPQ42119.1 MAG: Monomeric sarcosine oxidase [Candidatus Methanoperedens sp. BLZ1]MBZ0173810.1 FAD-binding oxidoreductase [Candidatus Methanoperedens nitroreducens]MCX9077349.1 FAD-dependent oxidoreductase [Candidatus Methanoperedens sp.]